MKKEKKRFFINLISFSIIFLSIFIIINSLYISKLRSINYIKKREDNLTNYLKDNNNTINYLFLGDSHAYYAINTDKIPGSFVDASLSEGPILTFFKLNELINKKIKIKNVVFELDPHTLSDAKNKSAIQNMWYFKKTVPLKEFSRIYKINPITVYIKTFFPIIGEREKLLVNLFSKVKNDHKTIQNLTKEQKITDAAQKIRYYFISSNPYSNIQMEYLKKIQKLLNENNINFIAIQYPLTKEFVDKMKNTATFDAKLYEKIINSSPKIFNYQNIYFDNKDLFFDSDHLNKEGAIVFSEKLRNDLYEINPN